MYSGNGLKSLYVQCLTKKFLDAKISKKGFKVVCIVVIQVVAQALEDMQKKPIMPVMVGKAHIGHKYYTLAQCNGQIDGFMYNKLNLLYCKSITKVLKL